MQTLDLATQRLFTEARSASHWLPEPVPETLLRSVYEPAKFCPTSMNCQPMRIRFVVSPAAKEKLLECVNPGNVAKTRDAPVVAVIGQDLAFPERLPIQFAHKTDARDYYEGKPDLVAATALRNSSLQAAWFTMAARHGVKPRARAGWSRTAQSSTIFRTLID